MYKHWYTISYDLYLANWNKRVNLISLTPPQKNKIKMEDFTKDAIVLVYRITQSHLLHLAPLNLTFLYMYTNIAVV